MADFEKAKKERELQKAATETSNGAVKVRRWAPPGRRRWRGELADGPRGHCAGVRCVPPKDRDAVGCTQRQCRVSAAVQVGTACVHKGCSRKYVDETSLSQECVHHPGAPVFHEGNKYWCVPAGRAAL